MSGMSVSTGADVESLCTKCGDVWHVIVAMVGDKIAKVQCKECNAYHRYRDPAGKKQAASPSRRRSTSTSTGRAKKTAAPARQTVEANMSKPIRVYSPGEEYTVSERIEHPKFGIGVVQTSSAGKAEVFFVTSGRKILATARPGPKLSRPPRIAG